MKNMKISTARLRWYLLTMILFCFTAIVAQTVEAPDLSNNAGESADNPIIIRNYGNLMWLSANHQNRFYRQEGHIEAPTNPRHNFTPIGNWSNGFRGTYNGDGYEIRNLYINQTVVSAYTGLFGYLGHQQDTARGTIRNIGLVNAEVGATSNSASPVYAAGTLVGMVATATIENCYSINARTNVNLPSATGGVIRVGGLIGGAYTIASSSVTQTISNCYFEGTINTNTLNNHTGEKNIGGIIGLHRGTLNNSYVIAIFTGISSSSNRYIGNIVGAQGQSSQGGISNVYWQIGSGSNLLRGFPSWQTADGKTPLEMRLANTYNNWNFSEIWTINPNLNFGLPYQRIFRKDPISTPAPRDLILTLNGNAVPTFEWTAPADSDLDFLGYRTYRNREVYQDLINDTSFTDEPLPGGSYVYYVTAVYVEGETGPVFEEVYIPFGFDGVREFGAARVGDDGKVSVFTIENAGSTPITVKIFTDGANQGDFEVKNIYCVGGSGDEDAYTIPGDGIAEVTVTFKSSEVGTRNTNLYVELVDP